MRFPSVEWFFRKGRKTFSQVDDSNTGLRGAMGSVPCGFVLYSEQSQLLTCLYSSQVEKISLQQLVSLFYLKAWEQTMFHLIQCISFILGALAILHRIGSFHSQNGVSVKSPTILIFPGLRHIPKCNLHCRNQKVSGKRKPCLV